MHTHAVASLHACLDEVVVRAADVAASSDTSAGVELAFVRADEHGPAGATFEVT